jgi:3beta-hydroxy-delta5-steroid dehydrogenase / steroid delta-isomerase
LKKLQIGNGTLLTICLRPTVLYGELDPYYVTTALKFGKENGNSLQKFGWGGERNQTTYAGKFL